MPVTSQVVWPSVSPGCTTEITVSADPATARIHADGEHRLEGKVIDQAGHNELCPGPRLFPLALAGMHTIDIRVINFEPTSIKPLVTATLKNASGAIVEGPVPCQRTVPPTDHYLVTVLATVLASGPTKPLGVSDQPLSMGRGAPSVPKGKGAKGSKNRKGKP